MTGMPLKEWIGLGGDPFIEAYGYPELIKGAVAIEVERVAREMERKRQEQEMRFKDVTAKPIMDALSTGAAGGAISKVFR